MKPKGLNNYQKILLTWAVGLLIGYFISWRIIGSAVALLLVWSWIIAACLGLQFWWGYSESKKSWAIQFIWVAVVLIGSVLTYFEMRQGVALGIHGITSGWFFLCSGGMLATAVLYHLNRSYLLLCVLYAAVGLFIAFAGLNLEYELYVSGIAFFGLCLLDVFLERSPWRDGLAE